MQELINQIKQLQNSPIKQTIDQRVKEFTELGMRNSNEIFKELCFCLMTANFSAEGGIRIQKEVNDGLLVLPEDLLASKLKALGHRFPNMRANFIVTSRKIKDNIKEKLQEFSNDEERRQWLVENIKGLGYKEASHFLRNIGYSNVAIIDFHIIDLLVKNNLIEQPKNKSLNGKKYAEIENILKEISNKAGINLGELDLYLWYMETGKVLK
ncbi:N-glycosylase/DNA lyase [Candidatus Pacearchaeota archaeon]|nr:N-glycosylase/DNA lyase [Candidatus Pacearchaeota archaeon]